MTVIIYAPPLEKECEVCSQPYLVHREGAGVYPPYLWNNDLKKINNICGYCKSTSEDLVCKTPGCRVLKEPDSSYCSRHDETSVVEIEKPKLQEEDLE